MKQYQVGEEEAGIRLDKFLSSRNQDLSRVMIQKQIEENKVTVNGKIENKASYKLNQNDQVTMQEIELKESNIKPQEIPIDILYEDDDIIVVNKAKGMVVHPSNGNLEDTLVNAIMAKCNNLSGIGGIIRPGIIHRLDKDTTGVLICAKNDKAHIHISEQMKNRQTKKIYLALVRGETKENEATINMPIGRSTKDRKKMAVSKNGKEAITEFKVLNRYKGYTLLEVTIKTGRTHQIRVHLSEIGYPVVGDSVYSKGKNPFGVTSQMLHASSIEFTHPTTNQKLTISAELPQYFKSVLEQLENEK